MLGWRLLPADSHWLQAVCTRRVRVSCGQLQRATPAFRVQASAERLALMHRHGLTCSAWHSSDLSGAALQDREERQLRANAQDGAVRTA